jgi:hypothetical protein
MLEVPVEGSADLMMDFTDPDGWTPNLTPGPLADGGERQYFDSAQASVECLEYLDPLTIRLPSFRS